MTEKRCGCSDSDSLECYELRNRGDDLYVEGECNCTCHPHPTDKFWEF